MLRDEWYWLLVVLAEVTVRLIVEDGVSGGDEEEDGQEQKAECGLLSKKSHKPKRGAQNQVWLSIAHGLTGGSGNEVTKRPECLSTSL